MTLSPADIAARRRRGRALQQRAAEGAPALTVLASFNLDLLPPFVVEALDRRGLQLAVEAGDFGQVAQGLHGPGEGDVLVVPAAEDLLAGLYAGEVAAERADELVDARLAELQGALRAALEQRPAATLYVAAFGTDRVPNPHVLDPGDPRRGQAAVERLLAGIRELSRLSPRIVVVDWDWHARALGGRELADERLWYLGRMRLGPAGLAELADLVARHVAAYHGRARKVIAVDLDGTVWGGVVGEVGLAGLDLGDEELGLAFREFQRELVRLHDSGTVLVAASKNNREDVAEVFERHPAMDLELSHFAAERINWTDKATNLREMAAELSLGLDSFVFLDDNPVEREWVRSALPEVLVPELPEDPAERPAFLRDCGLFDRIALTEADTRRADSYKAQGSRARAQGEATSFEDFLRSLEQEVVIEAVDEAGLARAAQLCQRTNQFNLTTRRHTAGDIERMLAGERWEVFQLAVRDRFGESGITGLAILHHQGETAELDTFLLSCRVLGRRVEEAFLAFLAARAAAAGARRLLGTYTPTAKNGQAAGFLPDHGFAPAGEEGSYALDLVSSVPALPTEMTVKVPAHA